MTTLIGAGAHARDIAATVKFDRVYPSHKWFTDDGGLVVIGINDPRTRARVSDLIRVTDSRWIHPRAWWGVDCYVGFGSHVNYSVHMTRTRIGNHCTISPGVTICGDVIIGDRVLIGAGATITDRVRIGNDVRIGAGAVVLPETVVPDGETWVGVPARVRH